MKEKSVLVLILCVLLLFSSCASASKKENRLGGSYALTEPEIERGWRILPIDLLARMLAIPEQIIFWDSRLKNRDVSDETLEILRRFLIENELTDVKVRVNQTAFFDQYRRLFTNDKIVWPLRIFPGLIVTTLSLVLDRFTGGDYYNPFTDTIHIFSNIPAVVIHEAGHAKDFDRQEDGGFYAMMRGVPGMDLIQEDEASMTALKYFRVKRDYENELEGYRILYPAYGSYVGSYVDSVLPFRSGSVASILGGHWIGRKKAGERLEQIEIEKQIQKEVDSRNIEENPQSLEIVPTKLPPPKVEMEQPKLSESSSVTYVE